MTSNGLGGRRVVETTLLLLSQRLIDDVVAFCSAYEFEDTFAAVTDAQRIDATDLLGLEFCRRVYKLARLVSRSVKFARQLTPHPRRKVILQRDFDLFFPVFSHTYELYSLAMIPNWRQRSRKAACYITEVWSDMLPEYLVELLAAFDHVFVGSHHSVQDVARITGRPCTYLPLAVDVLRFAPASLDQPRPIEICNIGRRSPVTHQALLEEAARRQNFYYYDTVAASGSDLKNRTFRVESPYEHRLLLATILKHSRYFIANRSYVNRPEFTHGREEISARFYEGAAAGTVMVGEAPQSEEFERQFDWPDAVINLPFDSSEICRVLADLNNDPTRLRAIRGKNALEAARRHDWLHRIQVVFNVLGLAPTDRMLARAQQLDRIALQCNEKEVGSGRLTTA
jgi:Glycosyl transferases group 1